MPLHGLVQLGHGHQHARMALTQKTLEPRTFFGKGRKQQAHQLCFAQAQILLCLGRRSGAQFDQCRRIAEDLDGLLAQSLGQVLAAHHHQGPLQVLRNTGFVIAILHEARVQPSDVRRDRRADEFVVADLRGQFVRLEAEKLRQQWPTLFQVADQQVVNVDAGRTTAGFEALLRTPPGLAVIGVEPVITVAAQFIEQCKQPRITRLARRRRLEPCLGGGAPQAVDELLLLTRRVTDEQGVDTAVPASDLSVELSRGQITVIPKVEPAAPLPAMADQQQVQAAGLAAGVGDRRQVVERQDFPIIDHQYLDPGIVIDKQCAVGPVHVFHGRAVCPVQPQRGDAQLECRRRPSGNGQLRSTQQCQGVAVVTGPGLDRQHLVIANVLHAPGRYCQALNQQLQCSAFGTGEKTQQSLQHLLIDIVHRLVMDAGHLYLPDTRKFNIVQTANPVGLSARMESWTLLPNANT
ncbi:hypothetical protein D3C71_1047200 [compost metagenome]